MKLGRKLGVGFRALSLVLVPRKLRVTQNPLCGPECRAKRRAEEHKK